jgi:hypothetical protein
MVAIIGQSRAVKSRVVRVVAQGLGKRKEKGRERSESVKVSPLCCAVLYCTAV